jgi:hypothetical protein
MPAGRVVAQVGELVVVELTRGEGLVDLLLSFALRVTLRTTMAPTARPTPSQSSRFMAVFLPR